MEFCDHCGTRLRDISEGSKCPKCKKLISAKPKVESVTVKKKKESGAIYIVERGKDQHAKVSVTCPGCGGNEVFRWFSSISGEHAGVKQERTVEHFKCAKCRHTWSKSF